MNILIIGLGSIAKKHILALKKINIHANIYALRSTKKAEVVEGVNSIFDLSELPKKTDFAIISNPTHLHYAYIEILARKKIPLFIEKPAVHSLENVNKLINLINEKQLFTYVACNLRFHPCLLFLVDKLKSASRINEVNIYCGSYLPDWRPGRDFKKIYSANAAMGGGVHLDLFHELDYATWLFGLPLKSKSFLKSASSLGIDAIDYANYLLEYDYFTVNLVLNYYRRKAKRQLEIVFEDEIWTVDLIKNEVINDSQIVLFKDENFTVQDTYVAQLRYFINKLENGIFPMNSFKESIEVLKICLNNE